MQAEPTFCLVLGVWVVRGIVSRRERFQAGAGAAGDVNSLSSCATVARAVASPARLSRATRASISKAAGGRVPGARRVDSRPGGPAKDKPTIRAVAKRARVAVSTVSRVLNGGYASAAAKRRVELAIQELGFSPSITARSLVTGRSGCIGLVTLGEVAVSHSPWFSLILGGVEEQLAHSRISVLLSSLTVKGSYDSSAVSAWIQEHRVDGLIFSRYTKRERPLFKRAEQAGLPVVLIGPDVTEPTAFIVRCNNVEAGQLAAAHLVELGHRRIAYAGGPRESIDSRDRLKGLKAGLAGIGAALKDARVWFGPSYAPESGVAYAEQFLRQPTRTRPTAVVLGNDMMALGFLRTVLKKGLRVPDDVSVLGFDGIPEGARYWPGLTTVFQPAHQMGATSCRALLELIGGGAEDRPTSIQYDVQLVVRESTGRVRSGKHR